MFCPIKANKSRKSHQPQRNTDVIQSNSTNISSTTNTNHKHKYNQDTHINPTRYVTADFQAQLADELTVFDGDIVIFQYSDSDSSGSWSHVLCLKTNRSGFVPSEILSHEPRLKPACRKKLPRSSVDPIQHRDRHDEHEHLHKMHNVSVQPTSNGDIIHRSPYPHLTEHQPAFGITHSLQGSSGKQSLPKFSELNFSTPGYYNLRGSDPRYEQNEVDFRVFKRCPNPGLFVVTNNFVAREENDLNVEPGEYVTVLNRDDDDWFWVRRECDGLEGFVPSRFICDFDQVKSILNKGNSTVTMKSSNPNDCHTYINHKPTTESLHTDQQSLGFQHI